MLQSDNEKIIVLYKKIRLITEKENDVISKGDIDKLEEYELIKSNIIRKIEKNNNSGLASLNSRAESIELQNLIQEILAMNEKNRKALISLQNDVMVEISSLQCSKKAHKAYSSQAYLQGS